MIVRCYRYALLPAPAQAAAIEAAAYGARRFWNALVAHERFAEREIARGRRGTVQARLKALLLGKRLTGVAAGQAHKRAEAEGISFEEAARRNPSCR